MAQRRSEELQLVAYALARCGVTDDRGKTLPPPWLGTASWQEAYDRFFPALADGREERSFRNTLKNARDAFDAHLPNSRIGWVDYKDGGKPWRQDTQVKTILERWQGRSEAELMTEVLRLAQGSGPNGVSDPDEEEPGPPEEGEARTEGGEKVYYTARYERSGKNRRRAVALHGLTCMACTFNFAAAYGAAAAGYIEVHHVMPLAEHGVRETDPATDLVVLCANCHRVVHRKKGVCLSLPELRAVVDGARAARGQAPLWSAP